VCVQELIITLPSAEHKLGRPSVSKEKIILMSIWVLANEESYRGVGVRFGVERGNCHRIFNVFCEQMIAMTQEYIKWPTGK